MSNVLTVVCFFLQCKRRVWQTKGALQVSASSSKNILIMGGTRFIGVFLSRLLVKEGHQVVLSLSLFSIFFQFFTFWYPSIFNEK
jgi:hypothetical protein